MSFMKEFLGGKTKTAALSLAPFSSIALPYALSSVRWHGDSRPACAVIAVHDLMSTSKAWSPFVRGLGQLPTKPVPGEGKEVYTTAQPADIYAVDLRHHGKAWQEHALPDTSFLMQCAADVVAFRQAHIPAGVKVHLLGRGLGAQVCALAALAQPTGVQSLTMLLVNGDASLISSSCCSIESLKDKLTILKQAIAGSKTWEDLQAALTKRVPSEWERMLLLQHVVFDRKRNAFCIELNAERLLDGGLRFAWPTITQQDVAFGGKTTVMQHNLSVAIDSDVKKYFPRAECVAVPSFGYMNGPVDIDLALRIAQAMDLVGTLPLNASEEE